MSPTVPSPRRRDEIVAPKPPPGPEALRGPRVRATSSPRDLVLRYIFHQARAVAKADREEADPEFDELISRFRLDPAALS